MLEPSKKVGQVSQQERDEIRELFERKNGLKELVLILDSEGSKNDYLYEKLVVDMGRTKSRFQEWWDKMANKYQWERQDNYHWEIDFESCDIYLVRK